jgi:hypothetical protein
LLAVVLYAVAALASQWPTWPGDPSRLREGDLNQMTWLLGWTPYALLHGHSLFATNALNYPTGVNLAQNTLSPLLGILAAPLTLAVNTVAAVNLLLWISFVLSAASMFFVLRRINVHGFAAFWGGAFYGFSPYIVCQAVGHLDLAFEPLPPWILWSVYELFRPDQSRRIWPGCRLGILVAAQALISAEVALTTVLVGAIALVAVAVPHPRAIAPVLRGAAPGLMVGIAIVCAVYAYPLYVMAAGPYRYSGPAYPGGVNADLLGAVLPTELQRLAPGSWRMHGSSLMGGNTSENGSYLGIPLLILMATFTVVYRRRAWVKFSALMVVVSVVLSLGEVLNVNGHQTTFKMPFALLSGLPIVNNVIASRIALYTAFFAALLVALGLDSLLCGGRASVGRPAHSVTNGPAGSAGPTQSTVGSVTRSPAAVRWFVAVVGVVAIVSLIPAWPAPSSPTGVPPYFSSSAVNRIPEDSVALISPYPSVADPATMTWPSVAGYRFKIIGGYALTRGTGGTSQNFPAVLAPTAVERYLWANVHGGAPYPAGPLPKLTQKLVCELRTFVRRYQVDTVLDVYPPNLPPDPIRQLFTAALGASSAYTGGVYPWYEVRQHLPTSGCRV